MTGEYSPFLEQFIQSLQFPLQRLGNYVVVCVEKQCCGRSHMLYGFVRPLRELRLTIDSASHGRIDIWPEFCILLTEVFDLCTMGTEPQTRLGPVL